MQYPGTQIIAGKGRDLSAARSETFSLGKCNRTRLLTRCYMPNPEKYTRDRNKEIGMPAFRRRIYFLSDHRAFAIDKHRVAN